MDMANEDKKKKGYDEYECKRFAEILMEAEEIKGNPKKMEAAEKHLKAAKKAYSSIQYLKDHRNKMSVEDEY